MKNKKISYKAALAEIRDYIKNIDDNTSGLNRKKMFGQHEVRYIFNIANKTLKK